MKTDKAKTESQNVSREELERRIAEIAKCRRDIIYFAEHYFRTIHDGNGPILVTLTADQKHFLKCITKKMFMICVGRRRAGKSTALCIYALWQAMWFPLNPIALIAQSNTMADEDMKAIQFAYDYLPSWMKCPIKVRNKTRLQFCNLSEVKVICAQSADKLRYGPTYKYILCDEFSMFSTDDALKIYMNHSVGIKAFRGKLVIATTLVQSSGHFINSVWLDDQSYGRKSRWCQCKMT